MKKEYLIAGIKYNMKDYGELTGLEEEKINSLLFAENTGADVEINLSSYEIFPIILVPGGNTCSVNPFDWRNLKNSQAAEILVDFIVEKKTSQDSMLSYMKESINQKLQHYSNMKENTAGAGLTRAEQ
jgi:hypothetical protein